MVNNLVICPMKIVCRRALGALEAKCPHSVVHIPIHNSECDDTLCNIVGHQVGCVNCDIYGKQIKVKTPPPPPVKKMKKDDGRNLTRDLKI